MRPRCARAALVTPYAAAPGAAVDADHGQTRGMQKTNCGLPQPSTGAGNDGEAWPEHLRSVRIMVMDHLRGVDLPALTEALNSMIDKNDMRGPLTRQHRSRTEPRAATRSAVDPDQ
jgi:hypothetical protein